MRIVIIGQKWLAASLLANCQQQGHTVSAVSAPHGDRLAQSAAESGIPNLPQDRLPDCDIILCAHAHVFVGHATRAKAKYGAFGYHPSLLPRHRGRDAVRWALHMREAVTGGTVYQLDDGADTGPIAVQDWCHIAPDDTVETLWRQKLAPMGLCLFAELLLRVGSGNLTLTPQSAELATWEPAFGSGKLAALG
ncbi:MAG: formyltransferase family protein [Eikenella sp.]|nr:formyltransferase family protein [Eikenella sp.]